MLNRHYIFAIFINLFILDKEAKWHCVQPVYNKEDCYELVDSYKMKVTEYEYVEINNISCIFSKMVAKTGRRKLESDVSQLCVKVQRRMQCLFI